MKKMFIKPLPMDIRKHGAITEADLNTLCRDAYGTGWYYGKYICQCIIEKEVWR